MSEQPQEQREAFTKRTTRCYFVCRPLSDAEVHTAISANMSLIQSNSIHQILWLSETTLETKFALFSNNQLFHRTWSKIVGRVFGAELSGSTAHDTKLNISRMRTNANTKVKLFHCDLFLLSLNKIFPGLEISVQPSAYHSPIPSHRDVSSSYCEFGRSCSILLF
jgi:hypothetical protein